MSGEKTEEATPKRLDEARRRGDVPRSRDLLSFVVLAAAVVSAPAWCAQLFRVLAVALRGAASAAAHPADPATFLHATVFATGAVVVPLLGGLALVAAVVGRLDAGAVFALGKVAPSLDKLDPIHGLSQWASRERWVDLLKSLVVFAAVAFLAVRAWFVAFPDLARLASAAPRHAPRAAAGVLGVLLDAWLPMLAVLAVVDVVRSRRAFAEKNRMSKDEVKREYKESDGDPHLRGERARMHRELLEHSAIESARRATVLVVNPTHLAVALQFDADSEQEAPEVVAKGEDHLALRMIEAAREAGVPVVRDIPLARGLYGLEIGDEIPEPLFDAVAAVLHAAERERAEAG